MNDKQILALAKLCARYNVGFVMADFNPAFDCGPGWYEGWIGGEGQRIIYVGVSPEGDIHS